MLFDQLLPSMESGEYVFNQLPDEKLFRIFERFLFNFYKRHLAKTDYGYIKKEGLTWQDVSFEEGLDDLLPSMETDICLSNESSRLIIECKFYESALQSRKLSGQETTGKFISGHVYQLYAYLKNLEISLDFVVEEIIHHNNFEKEIQKITDEFTKKIDTLATAKEKEIMTV